jgi:septum formation protein
MTRDPSISANLPSMLTLASGSPQRRAILEQVGIEFEVVVPDVEELSEGEPESLVVENALRKARAVRGERVLGADTAVALGERILGKPADRAQAESYLGVLSGREHEVWSGVALVEGGRARTAAARTAVRFRSLTPAEVGWYLDSEEWRERAGAYAIQGRGAALVEWIEGDYTNVVGLPVSALVELMGPFAGSSRARR